MDNYTYKDKTYLFNKLNKIEDKNKIRDIIKIIMYKDKDNVIEKEMGTYIKFNDLNNETYKELEQYMNTLFFNDNNKNKLFENDNIMSFTDMDY